MIRNALVRQLGLVSAVLAVSILTLTAEAKPKHREHTSDRQKTKQVDRQDRARSSSRASARREAGAHRSARIVHRERGPADSVRRSDRHQNDQRGAHWGVNAQRKKLAERQARTRKQETRLEHRRTEQRQELREAKHRFEDKIDRQKQQLRERDRRLDDRAKALHHASRHVYSSHRSSHTYHHDHSHHDRSRFGISFRIGSRYPTHSRVYGHHRSSCCSGGYWTWKWVKPLVVTRYDRCGYPYTVVIRAGYYKRVWVPHYCRLGLHIFYRD